LDIPDDLKALYKTVWELKQRTLVDMAADRGAFIDQSQSFNVHMSDPNFGKLTSLHFYAWKVCTDAFCNPKLCQANVMLMKYICFYQSVCSDAH
jgi:ribonucleotide reductase alpha subunit